MPAIDDLTSVIAGGFAGNHDALAKRTQAAIEGIFGERYRANSVYETRVSLMAADRNVPFAGFLHPDNPTSGVYGGMSLVWMPIQENHSEPACSLLTFVCGTRGLAPDEAILGRPGHARHLRALARHLERSAGVSGWVKRDPKTQRT
jgi:5-methylcytosine-specific restriction protein B